VVAAERDEPATRLVEVSTDVGFGPRWLDLGFGQVVGSEASRQKP